MVRKALKDTASTEKKNKYTSPDLRFEVSDFIFRGEEVLWGFY